MLINFLPGRQSRCDFHRLTAHRHLPHWRRSSGGAHREIWLSASGIRRRLPIVQRIPLGRTRRQRTMASNADTRLSRRNWQLNAQHSGLLAERTVFRSPSSSLVGRHCHTGIDRRVCVRASLSPHGQSLWMARGAVPMGVAIHAAHAAVRGAAARASTFSARRFR